MRKFTPLTPNLPGPSPNHSPVNHQSRAMSNRPPVVNPDPVDTPSDPMISPKPVDLPSASPTVPVVPSSPVRSSPPVVPVSPDSPTFVTPPSSPEVPEPSFQPRRSTRVSKPPERFGYDKF